jgi:hypothetical protein
MCPTPYRGRGKRFSGRFCAGIQGWAAKMDNKKFKKRFADLMKVLDQRYDEALRELAKVKASKPKRRRKSPAH